MATAAVLEPVPLSFDADGVIRVTGTRVPVDAIIEAFETGATAEEISADYSAVHLEDVYAVLTYYLRHREEVAAYLERRRAVRGEVRQQNEARWDYTDLRRRLLSRQAGHEEDCRDRVIYLPL